MTTKLPNREEALDLLQQYNQNQSLIHHALAVEAVMRYLARQRGEDEEHWGVIGLIHDLDYEKFPEEHCHKPKPSWRIRAGRKILSGGNLARMGFMQRRGTQNGPGKIFIYVDELTGLVTAAALVRPSRSVLDLEAKSVLKKWRQKKFRRRGQPGGH